MEKYFKQKVKYLLLLWISLILSITIGVVLYVLEIESLIFTIVVVLLFVYMFIILFISKGKISYYDMHQRYQLLLNKSIGLVNTKSQFDQRWLDGLLQYKFMKAHDDDSFTVYYRIMPSITKRTFIKTKMLEIITIVKNNKTDFYNDQINEIYKKIWILNEKKEKLNKQLIFQFKKYNTFNEEIKEELNKIINYHEGDNYLITINCGYFPSSQSVYYLHSNEYSPNRYYDYATNLLKTIIN